MLILGLAIAATSLFLMSNFNLQADFHSVILPRIVQGLGMSCFFVPLTTLTMSEIPQEQIGNSTGLYSLLRNLGGSIGVAIATTLLSRRAQFHQIRMTEHLDFFDPYIRYTVNSFAYYLVGRGVPPTLGTDAAMAGLYGQVVRQSMMLAFNDSFRIMFYATLAVVPLVFLFRKVQRKNGPMGAH